MVEDKLAKSGLEVYTTSDSNAEEVAPEDNEGFTLHNGTVKRIDYYDEMVSNSFEHDYEDISSNGSVSLISIDESRFYKGKKVSLKKAYNPNSWNDLKNVLTGFITEQSYSEDGVDLKIVGMSKLLEQEKQFSFTKTKISVILKEMIESAGLKCKIDTKGLKDKKIDYTNISSSSNSLTGGSGDADLDEWVEKIIKKAKTDLDKAEAIHNGLCKELTYTGYECSRYSTVTDAWKSKKLNCADTSRVTRAAMTSAGLKATVVHGPGHFWTIIKINDKEYASDATSNSRPFNKVWENKTYHDKCGDEPSC